jgi:hypothetical protein
MSGFGGAAEVRAAEAEAAAGGGAVSGGADPELAGEGAGADVAGTGVDGGGWALLLQPSAPKIIAVRSVSSLLAFHIRKTPSTRAFTPEPPSNSRAAPACTPFWPLILGAPSRRS